MVRPGKVLRGTAWLGRVRHGVARVVDRVACYPFQWFCGAVWWGLAGHGMVWLGRARHVTDWSGKARCREVRRCTVRFGVARVVGWVVFHPSQCFFRHGLAGRGWVPLGRVR